MRSFLVTSLIPASGASFDQPDIVLIADSELRRPPVGGLEDQSKRLVACVENEIMVVGIPIGMLLDPHLPAVQRADLALGHADPCAGPGAIAPVVEVDPDHAP